MLKVLQCGILIHKSLQILVKSWNVLGYKFYTVFLQVFLMVVIMLTGNYNFFNFLFMGLCLSLADDSWLGSGKDNPAGELIQLNLECLIIRQFSDLHKPKSHPVLYCAWCLFHLAVCVGLGWVIGEDHGLVTFYIIWCIMYNDRSVCQPQPPAWLLHSVLIGILEVAWWNKRQLWRVFFSLQIWVWHFSLLLCAGRSGSGGRGPSLDNPRVV